MSKRILYYSKGIKKYFIISFIAAILSVFSVLFTPIIIGQTIDVMIEASTDFKVVLENVTLLAILTFSYLLFRFLTEAMVIIGTQKLLVNLRNDGVKHLLEAPVKRIDQMNDGALMQTIIGDIEIVKEGLIQTFNQLFTGIFTIIGIISIMFYYQPILAILVIVLTPISLIFAAIISKKSYQALRLSVDSRMNLAAYSEEMIQNQVLVKSMNYEAQTNDIYQRLSEDYRKKGFKAVIYLSFVNPITRFINTFIYLAVGLIGMYLLVKDFSATFTIGVFSIFLSYAYQYTRPFNEISAVITQMQQAFTSLERIFGLIDIEPNLNGTYRMEEVDGNITFDHASFSYDQKHYVLNNITFNIKKGERFAVVGQTGSGKTTLINVLMKFYPEYQGQILIDGIELRKIEKESIRKSIGMVLQNSWLFEGTIMENIRFAHPSATDEEVKKAAESVHASDFIEKLENGYHTVIKENQLSTGEKQLIAIARVMLLNPPILILDEATSNIDALTEMRVQNAFNELMKGKTSIVIAHRLQTIMNADCIVVLDSGKVMEIGNHALLIQKDGLYAKLYQSQFE